MTKPPTRRITPPQAAKTDAIDIIALHAPPCKSLPQSIVDVLQDARTSVLLYNGPADGAGATGQEPLLGLMGAGAGLARVEEGAAAGDDLAAVS
jgi:hypothetical protein